MDNVQGRRVRNDDRHKRRGTLSVAAGLVLVGGAVLISALPLAAGSDGAQAPEASSFGPGPDPLVDSVQVQGGVIGKCADTGTLCTADDDCERTCQVAGTSCVEDADCPAGSCSFSFGVCSIVPFNCSDVFNLSCPGYCPSTLTTGCTPGTCCFSVIGQCVSTCVSQTCVNPDPDIPCDVDVDCPAGSCDNTGQTCRSPDECGLCSTTGESCTSTGDCPFIGVCPGIPTTCGAIGASCLGFCPATGFFGCTPGTCCQSIGGFCLSTCQGCGGPNLNVCEFGSCFAPETCLAVADVCLTGTNQCCGGVEDPGCCENDSQCAAFATKCRPGRCDPITNTCFTGDKAAACCEEDAQCAAFATKCRPGLCDQITNSCFTGDKGPDCCETDDQCADIGTKCRPGICLPADHACVLGPKTPADCCEDDAQCAEFATKCRPGLCDFTHNRCFTGPKILPDCCETHDQCADLFTKCRQGICDLTDNRCVLGPKTPENCCEDDAQCAAFATKCRPGLCDFADNRCFTGPKIPPDCCESDTQCADMGTKCRQGICDLTDNRCVLGPKTPEDCCASDAQCPGKCEFCNFATNRCEAFPPESCCESDADCPGKCDICDTLTNHCFKGVPGCCDSDDQCGKCKLCDFLTNTCFRPEGSTCCATDSDCPGKCDICNLDNNECVFGIPGCCESDAQCDQCDECDLASNTCLPFSCCTPSSPPERVKPKSPTNRYLLIKAGDMQQIQAIRVRFVSLPVPFDLWNGMDFWAGRPREVCENSGKGLETDPADCPPALPTDTFWAAPLVCEKAGAHYMDWHGWCDHDEFIAAAEVQASTCVGGLEPGKECFAHDDCRIKVALYNEGIVPSTMATPTGPITDPATYDIQVISDDCQNELEGDYSDPLTLIQSGWGDVCGPGPGGACSAQADGVVDVANDVLGVLDKFANLINLQKVRADLEPNDDGINNGPDFKVNVANDVLYCLAAFGGAPYPFGPKNPCAPGLAD